jgi:hypothetical protein
MYVCMYIQYMQGLYQSRLSTTDHALLLVAPATTAVYSLETIEYVDAASYIQDVPWQRAPTMKVIKSPW